MATRVTIGKKRLSGKDAWLYAAPAASYRRMLEDGCPTGGITDAGRTYEEQKALYDAYKRGELVATAAKPGTSKHETGRALDLAEPARAWVRSHGAKYGWMRDRVRNEPWHFEYELDRDTQIGRTPKLPEPLKPTTPQEDTLSAAEVNEIKAHIDAKLGGVTDSLSSNPDRLIHFNESQSRLLTIARRTEAAVVALAGNPDVDIDEASLAAALGPIVAQHLAPLLSVLPDSDIERIAEAVADEQAVRLAAR